jgi:hypothetical protein
MAEAVARATIAASGSRGRLELLQWNPRLRTALVVLAVLAVAFALGWADSNLFLEW